MPFPITVQEMRALRSLYHLMRADFLERVRRTSFLTLSGVTIYVCFAFVPPADSGFLPVSLGDYRGIYNSPWIGTIFGLAASLILSLFAFYLVKNAIDRDRQTRVGRVIASTPIRSLLYIYGKWLSNLALLGAILAILTVMALAMQLLRGEDRHIDLLALAAPIWLMGFPVMAVVAALALLFESIPLLSGGFGNVVYFFAWVFGLTFILASLGGDRVLRQVNDVFGMTRPVAAMQAQVLAMNPDYDGEFSIGRTAAGLQVTRFDWSGLDWTAERVGERLSWLLLGAGLAGMSVLPFDRFDPARQRRRKEQAAPDEGERGEETPERGIGARLGSAFRRVSPLSRIKVRSGFGQLLIAELRLLLYGQRWWWYLGFAVLWVVGLISEPLTGLQEVLPFIWLWPVLVWSPMGARERLHDTGRMVFSGPQPLLRQLPATWLAGILVAGLAGSSVALRLAAAGQWGNLFGWAAAALFIPSLALALGALSGGSRLFEFVYLLWWYLAVNGDTMLDFMSRTEASLMARTPWIYLALSAGLALAAAFGRRRDLQS